MKTLPLYLLLFTFIFTTTPHLQAQKWNKIKGEGPIISKNLDLNTIESIGLGISGDVIITQGGTQSVRIEAQANIIDAIKTDVEDGSWNIKFEDKVQNHKGVTIHITMNTLHSLSIGGSGSIKATNKFTDLDDVKLSIGGSGDIELAMDADDVKCSIGGSGTMDLAGTCDDLKISTAGSGDINAFDLKAETCKVSTAGSGDVEITVTGELKVSSAGSGDVEYKGSPKVKSTSAGSGSVRQRH